MGDRSTVSNFIYTIYCILMMDRSEIFAVRGVNRKEMLHATGKDIDCMFQVRATSIGLSTLAYPRPPPSSSLVTSASNQPAALVSS
jgi:hypothetical protein